MQYAIVEATNTDDLAKSVNARLVFGWKLHGGIVTFRDLVLMQAMTFDPREESAPPQVIGSLVTSVVDAKSNVEQVR